MVAPEKTDRREDRNPIHYQGPTRRGLVFSTESPPVRPWFGLHATLRLFYGNPEMVPKYRYMLGSPELVTPTVPTPALRGFGH
jgi:hypothetical protein